MPNQDWLQFLLACPSFLDISKPREVEPTIIFDSFDQPSHSQSGESQQS